MKRLLVLLLLATGCDGGTDGAGTGLLTADEARPYCEASCDAEIECGSLTTREECVGDCLGSITFVRADVYVAAGSCDVACSERDDTCFSTIEPLAEHLAFEEACRAKLATCEVSVTDIDETCETSWSAFDDDIGLWRLITPALMAEFQACLDEVCLSVSTCFESVAELHGIDF
jgi:hypothetical protein